MLQTYWHVYKEADVITFDCMVDVIAMFSSIEQMLSPYLVYVYQEADVIAFYDYIGRCYCHVFIYIALPNMHITVVEADVICLVEDGKSTFCESIMCGRCYCQVADGIPPGWRLADVIARWQMEWPLYYVIFSSGMSNRTSSHICGRWYLPTFLLRDGSLALMYIASFIALLRFWSSFPTILKFSNLML